MPGYRESEFMEDSSIMKEDYYDQAVACVKDYVLPAQRELCVKRTVPLTHECLL